MVTGPVGPVEVFFYWPEAVFGNFYWPGAIGPLLASSPSIFITEYTSLCRNLITISIFYGLPVAQLVITYQTVRLNCAGHRNLATVYHTVYFCDLNLDIDFKKRVRSGAPNLPSRPDSLMSSLTDGAVVW